MKVVIKIFGALVGLWIILVLIGLVLPARFLVERSTLIAARPAAVYPLVGDLKAWSKWGVWFQRDPAMQIAYSPVTTEVGSWSQWKSKSQGDGKMTVTTLRPDEDFSYQMEFADVGMISEGEVLLAPVEAGSTRVTLRMHGELGHSPVHRWFGVFMDKLVGPDFDAGLANLKRLSEATPH